MKASISLLFLCLGAATLGQQSAVSMGYIDAHVVTEERDMALRVNAWSKWSARDGAGRAAFRITAVPFVDDGKRVGSRSEIVPRYITEMTGCRLFIRLTDKDSFPIGDVQIELERTVDEGGDLSGFSGIGSMKMSHSGYLETLDGKWNVGWSCPGR